MTDSDVMTETWKPVTGASGYEASDDAHHSYGIRSANGELTAAKTGTSRYWQVKVTCDDGVQRKIPVHTLVLCAHRPWEGLEDLGRPAPPPGKQACHYDDDPDNNRLPNLRFDWPPGNVQDRRRNSPAAPKPVKVCILCSREFAGHRNARRCQDCVAELGRTYAEKLVAAQSAERAAEGMDYPLSGLLNLAVKYGGLRFVIAEPEPEPVELVPFRPQWLPIRSERVHSESRLRSVLIRWKAWLADSDAP